MNKKLIAVAVAGALGAPGVALAQASTVQIYGTLVLNYNYIDQGGSGQVGNIPKVKTDMINAHDANLGFKGEEALGGGISAWFQCESTMDVSGGGANGTVAPSAGATTQWCGRNSAFGMKGSMGNAYVGIWDTPMKIVMGNFRPFSTAGAYGITMLWNGTQSAVQNTGTSFTRRQTNLISYASPVFSGFQGNIAYSAANEAGAQTDATTASKPRLWSMGATYTNGPLILGGGYETHRNYNPTASTTYTGGTDRGWSLGAAYTFAVGGGLKASAIVTGNKYELNQPGAAGGTVDQRAWGIYGDWAVQGPHRVRAGYTHAGDTAGTAGTAAAVVNVANMVANGSAGQTAMTLYNIQYAYHFSKRTELNFGYARVANSNFTSIPLQTLGARNTGVDQSAWVFGTKHTF